MTAVDALLARARQRLERLSPAAARAAVHGERAVLVDIRGDDRRRETGPLPGAVVIARNALEWRCDPSSPFRDPRVSDPAQVQIIVCDEGYQSSLAAANLQDLGLPRATDMIGGYLAWAEEERRARSAAAAPKP